MKNLIFKTVILISFLALPASSMANGRMDVDLVIPVPPTVAYAGPLHAVVIPQTSIYAVPDAHMDIFFYSGWWWRPWQGRWYRSHDHRSGWRYYHGVPTFYRHVPSGWRNDFRHNRWKGDHWNHRRISLQKVTKDWGRLEKKHHRGKPEHRRYESGRRNYRDKKETGHSRRRNFQSPQRGHDRKERR